MAHSSPARLCAGVTGVLLVLIGVVGFFYTSSFGSPGDVDSVFGILDVNGWHNVVHVAMGALGLLAFGAGGSPARRYAMALGAGNVILGIWGFIAASGGTILGVIPVDTEDDVLHLVVGLAGLAAWLTSAATRTAAPAGPAAK